MAKQKTYTVWGSNPEKGDRFDKAEEWIAAIFESEEEADEFKANEAKNYKFIEKSIWTSSTGIRVASNFHSARVFCEDMSKNKAKKELLNLNTRCSAYFKNPIKGGSYVKFDKDGFVEGKGYDFYSNEDNEIHESKKTLNHLLLFEQFINEAKFVKEFDKAVLDAETEKDVLKVYPKAEFYVGKMSHFFGELEPNLFFKAYYAKYYQEDYGKKIKGDFKITSIYSEKGSNYVNLHVEESAVTEASLNESDIKFKFKGKTIKVDYNSIEVEDIDTRDYPDFSDAFISYAEDHRGRELSDEELDVLNDEHYDIIGEIIFDRQLYM